jgi:hypothetical protein
VAGGLGFSWACKLIKSNFKSRSSPVVVDGEQVKDLQDWEQRGEGRICENKYALLQTKSHGHGKKWRKRCDGDWTSRIAVMVGALDLRGDFVGLVFL